MTLAVSVLLPVGYLCSWLGLCWLIGHGWGNGWPQKLRENVFAPVVLYIRYELPGYEILHRATVWTQWNAAGQEVDWDQVTLTAYPPPKAPRKR